MDCWDQHDKGGVMVTPPPLKNDCFALPPGVDWTPVDDALAQLKSALRCVVSTETVDISKARNRFCGAGCERPTCIATQGELSS